MPRSIRRARGADATRLVVQNPINPLYSTSSANRSPRPPNCSSARRAAMAGPNGGISSTLVGGERVPVHIDSVWERPFCRLLHFERVFEHRPRRPQPRLLIVAPMSGHYATLLRGTVEAFLPNHDVYITEWRDARMVPLSEGRVRPRRLHRLHDLDAACARRRHARDGGVPAGGAGASPPPRLMDADDDPYVPISMTLMGGPIDTRVNPTAVNMLAEKRGINWFRRQRHHQGAVSQSRLHARRLSGLSAAPRLHEHESRSRISRRTAICSSIS